MAAYIRLAVLRGALQQARSEMATSSGGGETALGQPHLAKQDLSTLVSVRWEREVVCKEMGGARVSSSFTESLGAEIRSMQRV